jgi:hypothetical protein
MPSHRFLSGLCGACGVVVLAAGLSGACTATNGTATGQFAGGAGGGSSSASGTATHSNGVGGDFGFDAGPGSTGSGADPDAGCAGEGHKAEQLPLDIFIMLDQSGSMEDTVAGGGTKWDAVTNALKSFVTQPGLNGIGVGIQYFGQPPTKCTCSVDADCSPDDFCDYGLCFNCEFGFDSCDSADYSKADVEIAALPGVAPQIISSINLHSPSTGTPTLPALQGAIQHAKDWAMSHPGHVVIDIFATDGDPGECDTSQSSINAAAAAGYSGTPSIPTFVIGVGDSLSALNGIAAAGGTGQAFIVDTTQNVNQQFIDALNAIRGAALGCNYEIPMPMSGTPDYTKVNVEYTPGGSTTAQVIPQVADKASCPASGDGWYYDNPSKPTQILLCDSTCNTVSKDGMGSVNVVLGCKTVIK